MKQKIGLWLLFLLVVAACSGSKEQAARQPVSVKVIRVEQTAGASVHNYSGVVQESFSSSLSFQVSGNIERICVEEGQAVHKGQLLAVLNKANLQNIYDAAASKLKQAEDAYSRYQLLHEKGSMPEIKWVEVENSLQEARSMESIARKNLTDAGLYAPIDGVIATKLADVGTNVMPGTPVFKLITTGQVDVRVAVPENEIADTQKGQEAQIEVAALNGKTYTGKITEKGVTANLLSHTYDIKIRLANPRGELMPGMVCKVSLHGNADTPLPVVPHQAVQVDDNGVNFVWVAENGQAAKRSVRTDGFASNGISIAEGLKQGDLVIVEGYQKVSNGMQINIQP